MLNAISNETTAGLELAVALELFCVTLDWQPGDDEQGDYSVSVWAVDEDDAIRQVAEEMADSGEKSFETEAERVAYIQCVIDGAGQSTRTMPFVRWQKKWLTPARRASRPRQNVWRTSSASSTELDSRRGRCHSSGGRRNG